MPIQKILVVEDETDIAELIKFNLERENYQVETTASGEDGLSKVKEFNPDLIILDIMLPDLNGLDVCRSLKADSATQAIPVIILTARADDIDVVTGLEVGADDYIAKPFSPRVLIARIRAVMRRKAVGGTLLSSVLEFGELEINKDKHQVTVSGDTVDLTHTEFELLCVLAERPGWVFSRTQLIDALRDGQQVITDRAIDVQIVNLRRKLGAHGNLIQTVRGAGYRLREKP